ncbi:hypothetical protein Tco_0581488 [Tanacetum coccineum]
MVDENVPAPAPTRSDDQILPVAAWVPIGKSNYVLDLQNKQKKPIFQIFMDILQNTNFFRAGTYSFELDETQFVLDANLLREALEITPIDPTHQFVSPLSAILSMINQCLIGKTSRHDRPRYPVLQMLWGIITSSNVDYAELIPTKKGRKDKAHVIPYCRFTKLIICLLGRTNNIHQRSTSLFHLTEDDLRLGNLKFVPKGEDDKHDRKVAAKKEGKKKLASAKQTKPKPTIEKSGKSAPAPKPKISLESFQAQGHAYVGGVAIQEPVAEAIRPLPVVEGKGKAIVIEEKATQSLLALHTPKRRSTMDQFIFQRQTPATEDASTGPFAQPQDDTSANIIRDSPYTTDAETCVGSDKTSNGGDIEILQITEELGEDVEKQVDLKEKTVELDQDQARSDPSETHESRPPPVQVLIDEDQARPNPGISRVALAGLDLEPTHDEFMATLYRKVQESLKFPADEHVILADPLSSTGTLSSINNLEDAYAIGDQFINDKSTDDEPGKLNVESEVVSMVTVPIYQASSLVPPLFTPKLSDLEQTNKNLDNITQNLGSRVYTLELRDLPHKIDEAVRENVKEVVQIVLQAPFRDHFRDLPEEDMKEMLHQRMFESGTYKSLHEHIALYEALEASMARAQSDAVIIKILLLLHLIQISQPVEDIPIPNSANISDSEDTGSAHLPHVNPRPECLKPIPEDDRPATPEPTWVIPTSHVPDAENNWANALATTY